MARKRASMREGPLAELFKATEAAQRQQDPPAAPDQPPAAEPHESTVESVPTWEDEAATPGPPGWRDGAGTPGAAGPRPAAEAEASAGPAGAASGADAAARVDSRAAGHA